MKRLFTLSFIKQRQNTIKTVILTILLVLGLLSFGYFATYDLLLVDQGLQDFAEERSENMFSSFKFEGYKWLEGIDLNPASGSPDSFTIYPIRPISERPLHVKVFLKSSAIPTQPSGSKATLVVRQNGKYKQDFSIPLKDINAQQVALFTTKLFSQNKKYNQPTRFSFSIENLSGSLTRDSQLLLSTHIDISYTRELTISFLIAAISGTLLWITNRKARLLLMIAAFCLITLAVFRGGAFISNDFFLDTSGKASVFKTAFGHYKRFVASGEFYNHVYKRAGHFILPAITLALEPSAVKTPTKYYVNTWPTPRYIVFCAEAVCVILLVGVIYFYLSPIAAFLYPIVHCFFVPFLFDLYNMEDDALLLILSFPLTALILYSFLKDKFTKPVIASYFLIFFLMTLCKITFAFYCILIPLAFAFKHKESWKDLRHLCKAVFLFLAFVFSMFLGNFTNSLIARKGEAQPGYPYQSNNAFEMLWAANGLFGHDTGHPFIKSGRERDRIVAEAAGLPPNRSKRMRHAAIGDELIYKPDLKKALEARPSFFLNNVAIRFWYYGTMFWAYPNRGNYWRLDESRNNSAALGQNQFIEDEAGGKGYQTLVYRSRFAPTWKIAPQIFITSLFNLDGMGIERLLDLMLLIAACVGLSLTKCRPLIFIFLSSYTGKILFNTFIHGKVRYFNFVHPPMIIGICLFFAALYISLRHSKIK